MFKIIQARWQQGHRTRPFPADESSMPDRFAGRPELSAGSTSTDAWRAAAAACPTGALLERDGRPALDLGRCLFCRACEEAAPGGPVRFTRDYRLAVDRRDAFFTSDGVIERARGLDQRLRKLFGRSLKLRQVSAGGCNACEADVNVLNTLVWDLGRFGIQFVASPRHADGLLVTGAVTRNMRLALQKTYDAVPAPKIVIAVGACAISGGPYAGHPEVHDGIGDLLPVDLYIAGCPPHPATILDGLLRLIGRLEEKKVATQS
jgi:Ni,Fe-hydrogenase III small subunit